MSDRVADLEQVSLRDQWENEESDFTPWLARNIEYIGNALNIRLEVEETEADVGGYYADIHATDIEGERNIIIENQYGQSDHKHLGQSMVYAGGFDADIVVWVAEQFDDPHIDAIQWVNERTDESTGFFGVEMSLVQIEDSPVAPTVNVVERPSSWKAITGDLSETELEHRRFWHAFEERLEERGFPEYEMEGGRDTTASYVTKGFGDAYIRPAATARDNIYCMLRIEDESGEFGGLDKEEVTEDLRSAFEDLENTPISKSEIENIEWESVPGKLYDKIWLRHSGDINRGDNDQWEEYHDWIIDATRIYEQVFEHRFSKSGL